MTPNLPPVLPGFSDPIYGELSVKAKDREEYKDVAGADPGDPEWTVGFYGHNIDFWHSLRLGSAIARANGIGGDEQLKRRLDSLSDDAKDWLDQTCHRFADSQGYHKSPKLIEECLQAGLIEKHRGRIEVSGEVMNLVYSESYFRAQPTSDPCESVVKESLTTESPKPDEVFSININWHPDYDCDPDWKTMTKAEFLDEWQSDEEGWQNMVEAGAVVSLKPTPPKTENKELCQWLRDNSSGIYRKSACAADVIEGLESDLAAARRILNDERTKISILETKCSLSQEREQRLRASLEEIKKREAESRRTKLEENSKDGYSSGEWFAYSESARLIEAALAPANPNSTPDPNGWRPIETAPKDDKEILLWLRPPYDEAKILYWSDHEDAWVDDGPDGSIYGKLMPSHWMPLPEAPASSGKGEG